MQILIWIASFLKIAFYVNSCVIVGADFYKNFNDLISFRFKSKKKTDKIFCVEVAPQKSFKRDTTGFLALSSASSSTVIMTSSRYCKA